MIVDPRSSLENDNSSEVEKVNTPTSKQPSTSKDGSPHSHLTFERMKERPGSKGAFIMNLDFSGISLDLP